MSKRCPALEAFLSETVLKFIEDAEKGESSGGSKEAKGAFGAVRRSKGPATSHQGQHSHGGKALVVKNIQGTVLKSPMDMLTPKAMDEFKRNTLRIQSLILKHGPPMVSVYAVATV
ncbi:hypothetical protein Dimus_031955 [Dionaea muscipula]